MNQQRRFAIAMLAAFALLMAACSDSGDSVDTSSTAATEGTAPASTGTTQPADQPSTTTTADTSPTGVITTTTTGATTTGSSTTVPGDGSGSVTTTTAAGGGGGGEVYGTDQNVLSARCVDGDNVACDVLFMLSSQGSGFEATGSTCGGRDIETDFCSGYSFADATANAYGDHPFLDALYDMCDSGNAGIACQLVCDVSPAGSAYETYGCDNAPFTFGDDAFLDSLWTACEDGDFQACDDLFFASPFDSEYEAFGDTCGNRNEPAGACVDIYP